jgi:hypothetical protein
VCCLLCYATPFGFAKPRAKPRKPASAQRTAAEKLTDEGLAALKEKNLSRAYAALSESYRLAPTAEGLFHLARLAREEQRTVESVDLFRRYLSDPAKKNDDDMLQVAREATKPPFPLAAQVIVLTEPGAFLSVDERLVGMLPLSSPLLLSPGEHRMGIEYPNKRIDGQFGIAPGRYYEVRFDRETRTLVFSLLPAALTVDELTLLFSEQREDIRAVLLESLRSVGSTALTVEHALNLAPHLRDCMAKPNCQQLLAQKAEVEFVLHATAKRMEKSDGWLLRLFVRHRDVAEPAAQAEVPCPGCSPSDVLALLKKQTPDVLAKAYKRRTGTLLVSTEPTGAEVFLGSMRLGTTPLRRVLWAEPIKVSLRANGYKPLETTVTPSPNSALSLELALEPIAHTVVRAEKRKLAPKRKVWPWIVVGAGAAATLGVSLLFGLVPQSSDRVDWLP